MHWEGRERERERENRRKKNIQQRKLTVPRFELKSQVGVVNVSRSLGLNYLLVKIQVPPALGGDQGVTTGRAVASCEFSFRGKLGRVIGKEGRREGHVES